MDADFPVSGRLRNERLPKILVRLQRTKKTGMLVVWRNDQHKTIYIKDGDIIFASSKYEDDWLGVVLLKLGKITLSQHDKASEVTRKTQKRLGAVLVEQGVLNAKDLFSVVTYQVKEIILSLFTWLDGEYRFDESSLPADEVITLKMSTANLILDGIRRINDLVRLRNELPPLDTILRITSDPLILFQDIQLTEPERSFLLQVDGKSTLSKNLAASDLPAFDTIKLVAFFLSVGLVEIGAADDRPEKTAYAEPASAARTAQGDTPRSFPDSMSMGSEPNRPDPAGDPVLAREEGVKQRGEVVEGREEIFRKDPQRSLPTKDIIQAAYDAMENQNYYETLGIQKGATREEIRRAYFRLAKDYHPDRHFQTGLEKHTPMLEALFRRITEAYDTLLEESKRNEYDAGLITRKTKNRGVGAADASPEMHVHKGQQALQNGDIKAAVYFFEAAVKAGPDKSKPHALLAKTLTRMPGRQRDAETHFKKAIELDPAGVDHYLGLGMLYKRSGMHDRARRQFEEALIWDPENRIAKEELNKV
jgi:tetratricopeptide (TPR) repeat protein